MNLLILGKIPPPSGGVTIHVSRLMARLKELGINFDFFDMSRGALSVFRVALKYKVIHLHTSNPYFRFLFAVYCSVLNIKLLQTYHGDLGRFKALKNAFDLGSVRITAYPVVINQGSYEKALKLNRNARLISSFIAPVGGESLEESRNRVLELWRTGYEAVFCTNASCLKFDKHGKEVYGGSELLKIFTEIPRMGLVFSDPSGEYLDYFKSMDINIPSNLLIIEGEHSFMGVIKKSDCLIRASTTDGDSVSIKEAFFLGVPVIASDCVERPQGCRLYPNSDYSALKIMVEDFQKGKVLESVNFDEVKRIAELYG